MQCKGEDLAQRLCIERQARSPARRIDQTGEQPELAEDRGDYREQYADFGPQRKTPVPFP